MVPPRQILNLALTPGFWIFMILAMTAGYGLKEMKRWSWYVFIATMVLLVYYNALVTSVYGESHQKFLVFLISLLGVLVLSYRVSKEIKVPYFFPKIRWWETNPRYRLVVPVQLGYADNAQSGEILDLSIGGCFIRSKHPFKPHQKINVDFEVFGLRIHTPGVIIWSTPTTVTHPQGIGIKFGKMDRAMQVSLRAICRQLRMIANLHSSSRHFLTQEEFNKRLAELQNQKLSLSPKGKVIVLPSSSLHEDSHSTRSVSS
jgi:Tfp pilus assembly protein PilZ